MKKTVCVSILFCILGGCGPYENPVATTANEWGEEYRQARAQVDAASAQLARDVQEYNTKEAAFISGCTNDQLLKYKKYVESTGIDRTIAQRALAKSLSASLYQTALSLESEKVQLLQRGQYLDEYSRNLEANWERQREFLWNAHQAYMRDMQAIMYRN